MNQRALPGKENEPPRNPEQPSPHRRLLLDAYAYYAAFEIADGNAQELRASVAAFVTALRGAEPEIASASESLKLVVRRLHNWLAACYSLRMATDIFLSQHEETLSPTFTTTATARYDVCFKSPVAGFVHELRGYQQHHRVPVSRGYRTIRHTRDGVSETAGVKLIVYTLRQRKRWQGAAREFLDGHPKEIDLLELEVEYQALLKSFMGWFVGAIQTEFPLPWGFPRDNEGSLALP